MQYIALVFTVDFVVDPLQANGKYPPTYLPFVVMLLGAGAIFKAFAVLPFLMTIGLFALELLVAFLQAYVFAMLTCMYLNDAVHPGGH